MKDRLEDLVRALPRHLEPERNLWPDIAAQLRPRRHRKSRQVSYRLAAAIAAVAIALGAYVTLQPARPVGTPPPRGTQANPDPETVLARNLATVNADIARITDALAHDPDNPALYHFLFEAYRHRNRLVLERTRLSMLRSNMS